MADQKIVSADYHEKSRQEFFGEPTQVSPGSVDGGPAGGSITITKSVSHSVEVSIEGGVDIPSQLINLSMGVTVGQTFTSEVSMGLNVPAGKKATVTFTPKLIKSIGTIEVCRQFRLGHGEFDVSCEKPREMTVIIPVTKDVNGIQVLDGEYDLKIIGESDNPDTPDGGDNPDSPDGGDEGDEGDENQ